MELSQLQQGWEKRTRRKKLSQSPAAVRMRRSRCRKRYGAVPIPPLDVLPDIIERLARLGWIDPNKAKKADAKAIGTALLSLAEEALKAGATPPKGEARLIAFRLAPESIQAMVDYQWLPPWQERQRVKDIVDALFGMVNAALKAQLYGEHRPRSFVNPRRPT